MLHNPTLRNTKMTVVHCKKAPYDVYIGRPSKWGNPFTIGKDGTREQVIENYSIFLQDLIWDSLDDDQHLFIKELAELNGKTLGCWCSPQACHGDVLLKLAAWAANHLDIMQYDGEVS